MNSAFGSPELSLRSRTQGIAVVGLLTAIAALTVVAIGATRDVKTEANNASSTTQIAESYYSARFHASQAISQLDAYRLTHNPATAKAGRLQVEALRDSLAGLAEVPGQKDTIQFFQGATDQLMASVNRADRLYKNGHVQASERLDAEVNRQAEIALRLLSSRAVAANHLSRMQVARIQKGAGRLGYATPIVLIGLLLLAVVLASVVRRDRRRITTIAATDGLTGLPNRLELARVANATLRAHRDDHQARDRSALLLLDLDRFKEVNDGLGHEQGDQLLRSVAGRLRGTVSRADTVARIGGDEFVVFLASGGTNAAVAAATRIREALSAPFAIDGIAIDIDVSIGIAVADGETLTNSAALMRAADLAMYAAKASGGGHAVYTPELGASVEDKVVVASQIRRALEADQLVLHYQPQVSLDDRRLVGVEALVRWEHPVRGLVGPAEFLPAIEDHQIIDQVTAVVLRKAFRQSRIWQRKGLTVPISVNVATRALLNTSFPQEVANLLEEYGVEPRLICLELTESTVMRDSERCARTLWALHDLGVRLSVDDYGTGYASMVYLKDLPLDELKIDRSFVAQMMDDGQHRVLTHSVIELGHNLGLSVVAEGVENPDVRQALREAGCDIAQGFLYSTAVPADQIVGWQDPTEPTEIPEVPEIPVQRTESELTENV